MRWRAWAASASSFNSESGLEGRVLATRKDIWSRSLTEVLTASWKDFWWLYELVVCCAGVMDAEPGIGKRAEESAGWRGGMTGPGLAVGRSLSLLGGGWEAWGSRSPPIRWLGMLVGG